MLLVTDADLVRLGLPGPLVEELAGHGVRTTIFDGVKPDPTCRQVERGVAMLKEGGCDAVLALGGGSRSTATGEEWGADGGKATLEELFLNLVEDGGESRKSLSWLE